MEIKDARSLSGTAQESIRFRAVKAVLSGEAKVDVARSFRVSRQAIGHWVKRYKKGGQKALRSKKRRRPKGGALDQKQLKVIARLVRDRHPEQLKLPFFLWTRQAVSELIEMKCGLKLSIWTVGRYLKRMGFSPQKPSRRAIEQSPIRVRRWLKEEYPKIRKEASAENAEIFWGDEMGSRSDHTRGRTYGLIGETPVIPVSGQRFKCNMISALTNRGTLYFMVFKDSFTTDVFLDFLRRLVRQAKRKVFIIVDGHPVHRSKKVRQWLEKHQDKIRLFFLPPYSPELNPDELLNQDVKTNAVGRKRAKDQNELMSNIRNYLRGRQRRPHLVMKYFHAPKVKYAA